MTTNDNDVLEIGRSTVRILIPSRRKDGAIIHSELRAEWESKAAKQLETAPFGGSTPSDVTGSFVHDDGRITRERITVRASSCPLAVLGDDAARRRILAFGKELCAALGQESVFVGWGDVAYVVSAKFDPAAVAVVPFGTLPAEAQPKLLTMGWGGIDHESKVLQVLSLDAWTLPQAGDFSSDADSALTLRAVLREEGGGRRAWSWDGDLPALKKAAKRWSTGSTARPGDLVFLRSRPEYLDVAMFGERGVIGPRDLRLSHGQLNPVTRHLLLRILRREWDQLRDDLGQKPIDQRFFPKLQKLRSEVEEALVAAEEQRRSRAGSGRRRAKKSDQVADTQEARRALFRSSVLTVGRMMFLRFLAEKKWPGGRDELIAAWDRHRDSYYTEYVKPLWFDVLNVPVDERRPEIRRRFADEHPYLNGGLFLARPGELERDLPGRLFDPGEAGSFLRLFRDFEFSLNEHAGSDESLRIDPSLFGKALESFNSIEDKKSEGVHYTPKPIAWAMAVEAITLRLAHLSGLERDRIERLLRGERSVSGREARQLISALDALRIVDPAVGSGVLLWASLEVMLALDSACQGVAGGGDGYQRGSATWGQRSRHFVCNCLYGVDISEEAVELARLRLWLAVALSEEDAQPLPDLELNVCVGDSLLPLQARAAAGKGQMPLGIDDASRLENELIRLAREYAAAGEDAPTRQRELRGDVMRVRRQLAAAGKGDSKEDLPLDWEMFFPHVLRSEKRGFDVVIANPPYIRLQNLKDKRAVEAYKAAWPVLARGNADLSFAFVELALRRLAAPQGGQVAFIQPNFRHHDAAEGVRRLLVGADATVPTRLNLWVDFDDAQVFPTAKNYVALLFAERSAEQGPQREFTYSTPKPGSWMDQETTAWMRPRGRTHPHPADGEWLTVEHGLRARVLDAQRRASKRLGELVQVKVGVQTSADRVFLFEEMRRVDAKTVEVVTAGGESVRLERALVRPCLKGSAGNGYVLLFPYDKRGALIDEDVIQKRFPLAWEYLTRHKAQLEAREGGKFAGTDWYRFGRDQGFEACSTPKVLVPALLRGPRAEVDLKGKVAFTASGKGGGGAWALVPKPNASVSLEEIADIVSSQAAWDHALAYGSPQQGGWRGVDREVLEAIPVTVATRPESCRAAT